MKDKPTDVNHRIAGRVRELRAAQGLSLDALARRSGVSRSMISVIERGQSSPTASVLEKLAVAFGISLPALFQVPPAARKSHNGPVSRRHQQLEWQDPGSGYIRRDISPVGMPQPMQIVEVQFPPGARVAFENAARHARVYQQIWLLGGRMDITVGYDKHRLRAGDCLAMELGRPTMFHNPTRESARYAIVIMSETPLRR